MRLLEDSTTPGCSGRIRAESFSGALDLGFKVQGFGHHETEIAAFSRKQKHATASDFHVMPEQHCLSDPVPRHDENLWLLENGTPATLSLHRSIVAVAVEAAGHEMSGCHKARASSQTATAQRLLPLLLLVLLRLQF